MDDLSGESVRRDGVSISTGRILAYRDRDFRSWPRADSGVGGVRGHLGPPTAPNNTASAFSAAFNAVDVRGTPWVSMDACHRISFQ